MSDYEISGAQDDASEHETVESLRDDARTDKRWAVGAAAITACAFISALNERNPFSELQPFSALSAIAGFAVTTHLAIESIQTSQRATMLEFYELQNGAGPNPEQ